MIESERSFINPTDFWKDGVYKSTQIDQYYITSSDKVKFTLIKQGDTPPQSTPYITLPELPNELKDLISSDGFQGTIRLRKADKTYIFTKKIKISSISSLEIEHEIDKIEFESISALSQSRLKKTRHYVKHGQHTLEIDEYVAPKEEKARIRLEVEFPSEAEAKAFTAPPEFGTEVTHIKGHGNKHYADHGFSHWEKL